MSAENNKAIVRRLNEELWEKQNLSAIDEYVAADFVNHDAGPGTDKGIEGFRAFARMVFDAVPDFELTVHEYIAEGDRVASRWTGRGTHAGELLGIPATGNALEVTGMTIDRLAGGKVVERWGESDQMGMMQQMGVIPAPEQA